MRLTSLFLALLACGTPGEQDPSLLAADQVGPVHVMGLSASGAMVAGYPATFVVTNAPPNQLVYLGVSQTTAPNALCPPLLTPICIDLVNPVSLVGIRRADAAGVAVFPVQLPSTIANLGTVHLQAASTGPLGADTSVVYTAPVLSPTGDADNDGLDNGTEAGITFTDPLDADTDGGGQDDGEEVANGTDPRDVADDVVDGDCLVDFAAAYAAVGQGGDPNPTYAALGVSFDYPATRYGVIGGDVNGDPGNWSDPDTVPDEALGLRNASAATPNGFTWSSPVVDVSFDVRSAAGSSGAVVEATAWLGGVSVGQQVVTVDNVIKVRTVSFAGPVDEVTHYITSSQSSYVIDDVAWTGPACP